MSVPNTLPGIRIAVTGSRGKSGVVRLLHAGLCACGLNCRARVTGVLPRELTPSGERPILRAAGANVAELKWWLSQLPPEVEAVVTENSAVSPELQRVCPEVLRPTLTVLTNTRTDHEALWGTGENDVLRALSGALPRGGTVVLPRELAERPDMAALAEKKELKLHPVEKISDLRSHLAINIPLALKTAVLSGADKLRACAAMKTLAPDIADSRVLSVGGAELAFAFSINDLASTQEYFTSLGWKERDTVLVFNHRGDRRDRLRAFEDWMRRGGWKEVRIIGDRPIFSKLAGSYVKLSNIMEFGAFIETHKRVFGCGNAVHGLPLAFRMALEGGAAANE